MTQASNDRMSVRSQKRLSVCISASPRQAEKKFCQSPVKASPTHGTASEVTPFLFISDDRVTNDALLRYGITAILDCRTDAELDVRGPLGGGVPEITKRLHLPLRDNQTEDAAKFFVAALNFIEEQRSSRGKVLVHCTRGISRSSAVACAFLIWSQDLSYREALSVLRLKHPCADPNPSFSMQLVEFASSRSRDVVAYEVASHGQGLVGPLTRDIVDALLCSPKSVVLIVARHENRQYLWCGSESSINSQEALRSADMLSLIKMAPSRVELLLNPRPELSERFHEVLSSI